MQTRQPARPSRPNLQHPYCSGRGTGDPSKNRRHARGESEVFITVPQTPPTVHQWCVTPSLGTIHSPDPHSRSLRVAAVLPTGKQRYAHVPINLHGRPVRPTLRIQFLSHNRQVPWLRPNTNALWTLEQNTGRRC